MYNAVQIRKKVSLNYLKKFENESRFQFQFFFIISYLRQNCKKISIENYLLNYNLMEVKK